MFQKLRRIKKQFNKFFREFNHKVSIITLVVAFSCSLMFPQHTLAYSEESRINSGDIIEFLQPSPSYDILGIQGKLPEIGERKPYRKIKVTITAYNSLPAQTDSTPCITANGFNVCEHGLEDTIAANFLPFGTKVRIPELFGDRIFIVRDRMNPRYSYGRLDVWMKGYGVAKKFGVKYTDIEIY